MKHNRKWYWIFVGPVLIAFAITVIIPLISGICYSFTEWNGRMDIIPAFTGIKNYINALADHRFRNAFWFTTVYTIASIILVNVMGFALALLVTRKMKLSNVMRTIFFMPNLIGGLILGFIWQFIFIGVFETIGDYFNWGFFQAWLSNQSTGFWGLIIILIWQMAGYMMIIYIAALQNIPGELIEAAKIDGAGAWNRTWHITIPMVMPAVTISVFLTLANSFKLFDQNLALTNGGPGDSTEMLALNIYKTAFVFSDFGGAQAKAVIFFLIVAAITLVQVFFAKRRELEM